MPAVTILNRAAALIWLAATASAPAVVTIDWVVVGNPGNAGDPSDGDSDTLGIQNFGSVASSYRIGKYEVTNTQYVEFLTAKAATATSANGANDLYNTSMGSDPRGGITRSGSSGSYTYTVRENMADKPVTFVSHRDAQRFANWMHNGQGSGSTETGAYTVGSLATHSVSASMWIPTENEWYKAAYHQPFAEQGDTDGYWLYPTRSNTAPTPATATAAGVISNPGANVANYDDGAVWNAQTGNLTTVGSAGESSASYYGTMDQGGNVWEWNEAVIGSTRGIRGGHYGLDETDLRSSFRNDLDPLLELNRVGFRLASAVPEPSRALLLFASLCWLLCGRRRGPIAI